MVHIEIQDRSAFAHPEKECPQQCPSTQIERPLPVLPDQFLGTVLSARIRRKVQIEQFKSTLISRKHTSKDIPIPILDERRSKDLVPHYDRKDRLIIHFLSYRPVNI